MRLRTGSRSALVATGAVSLALVVSQAVGSGGALAATSAASSGGARERVIVMLRDQLAATPDTKTLSSRRRAAATSQQQAVLNRLAGARASHVKHLTLANMFTAEITTGQAAALAADPAVASVVRDAKVAVPAASATAPLPVAAPRSATSSQATAKSATPAKSAQPTVATSGPSAICPADPAKPLLEPEALSSMHAASSDGSPSAQDLTTGAGVKVAFIADGIDPNSPDFIRADGSHVITDYQDFSGDGPNAPTGGAEAFGDASSIAAQGLVSHDLSQWVNQAYPLPAGCNIRILGVSPGASIVALKAGGEFLFNSAIVQSIDYAVTVDHVDVINQSFGGNIFPDSGSRLAIQTVDDAAVAAGVTVTASSGDGGVTGTVGSPATDPLLISAGASTDNRLYEQIGYAAAAKSNGKWVSDNISALSSAGITQAGRTIDVTAPGEGNWAVCSSKPEFEACPNARTPSAGSDIQSFGGTSESAPLTAGVAALVISAYRSTHANASPSPAVIKTIITSTAQDMGLPAYEQGAGLVDARKAVEAALTYPGAVSANTASPTTTALPSHIALSTDEVTMVGAPGSSHTATVNVTNVGTSRLGVKTGARTFATFDTSTKSTTFDATTLPTMPYWNGQTWAVKEVHFTVASGADRLLTRMIWQGSRPDGSQAVVRLTLLAPDGTLVANSRPQGGASTPNYANVDVRRPVAGTWTAVLYSLAGTAGYTGPIKLQAASQHAVAAGKVTPASLSLAPGQTKPVQIKLTTPASGGDADYSATFADTAGSTTTASVVMRALIPINASGVGKFTGLITGGNARAQTPGQTFTYEFDVPRGQRDLGVSMVLSKSPGDIVDAVLVDPNGETANATSNIFTDAAGTLFTGLGIQTYDAAPLAGRWTLVVVVQNPVTGTELQEKVLGQVRLNTVKASAAGLPNAASVTLPKGTPTTVQLHFKNNGVESLALGVDARTNTVQTIKAVALVGKETITLPQDPTIAPVYLVPPETSGFSTTVVSSLPTQLELSNLTGGIDVITPTSTSPTAAVSEAKGYLGRGLWGTVTQEVGPFGNSGGVAGTATQTGQLTTLGFDPAVTSGAGDQYLDAVNPAAPKITPVVVNPGDSVDIPVTITPGAASGTVVTGHLNLVTLSGVETAPGAEPFQGSGSLVAQLPYSYTVG